MTSSDVNLDGSGGCELTPTRLLTQRGWRVAIVQGTEHEVAS